MIGVGINLLWSILRRCEKLSFSSDSRYRNQEADPLFLKSNPSFSIRILEASSFHRYNVGEFFKELREVSLNYNLLYKSLCNLDEEESLL